MKADRKILVLGHRGLLGGAVVSACGAACSAPPGGREAFDLGRLGRVSPEAVMVSMPPKPPPMNRREARETAARLGAAISGEKAGPARFHGGADEAQELILEHQPDVVINCAAFTGVDRAEAEPEKAFAVNALGVEALARACARAGAHLVHISTDYVFDGKAGRPYRESDQPAPLSQYGKSKLEGEKRVLAALPSALVVRTAWLFGPGKKCFVAWLLERARAGLEIPVVTDQTGSPTYSLDLAEALLRLVSLGAKGILHVVNGGTATRMELAREALSLAGLDDSLIRPVATRDLNLAAARPLYSALDGSAHGQLTKQPMAGWRGALKRHLAEYLKEG